MKNYQKLILAGGSGFLGQVLTAHFKDAAREIIVLTRGPERQLGQVRYLPWDGRTPGPWVAALEGADAVINLAGRSVDCRYNARNRAEILLSRVNATAVLGEAIRGLDVPPRVWLNLASATYYRHAEDRAQDEATGQAGTGFSVEVCQAWEKAFWQADAPPGVRRVLLRTALVLGTEGGAYPVLAGLVRWGLGGTQGPGSQMVSWVHADDFARMVAFCVEHGEVAGTYNCAAPAPLSNTAMMRTLRYYLRRPVGLPSPRWMLELGAFLLRTEPELVLKSRWVAPTRMLQAGFEFKYPNFNGAVADLSR
jgi:uncharacterized protein (TIGR01777 family)